MDYTDYREIIKRIAEAARKRETVEIYYPATENTKAGWREVEPYNIATDSGEEGENLVYGKEHITPGHIFNGYTVGSGDNHLDSFIIGKIKSIKKTGNKFAPRNGWEVSF